MPFPFRNVGLRTDSYFAAVRNGGPNTQRQEASLLGMMCGYSRTRSLAK